MATETELKLRITPEHLARLRRHRLFKTHQLAAPVTRHLHNIYFDTPKLDLNKHEMALRLRRVGGRWLQTLKGGGQVRGGLHQRNEWEASVASARLDFSVLEDSVLEAYLPQSLRKKLKPVFVTDFYRTSRMVEYQGAVIEVCMDHGEVKTSQRSAPICEVELELKSGEAQQLFELALAILEIAPFELEAVSKAERGFRLMSEFIEQPVKAEQPKLSKKIQRTELLQTLIWSCLLHLQQNLHGMVAGNHAEYLHQIRVALRRLRVALGMAASLCADEQLNALREEVAALGITFGRVREWDVFLAEVMHPIAAQRPEDGAMQALLSESEQRRTDSYAALRDTALTRDIQRLMLRFSLWMNSPYWQQLAADATDNEGMPSGRDFATRHLHHLAKVYRRELAYLDRLVASPDINLYFQQLHALRINVKKLRYSIDFFKYLYGNKKSESYLVALVSVQETLGKIHDCLMAHRLLEILSEHSGMSGYAEAVRLIRENLSQNLSDELKLLHKPLERFGKQTAFWKK